MALTDPTGYAPAGPLETAPSGPFTGKDARLAAFIAALNGAELGAYDRRIVDWLVGLDDTTNRTIVSLIWRARTAGPPDQALIARAAELAKAMSADPEATGSDGEWTVRDVINVALGRGLDALQQTYLKGGQP